MSNISISTCPEQSSWALPRPLLSNSSPFSCSGPKLWHHTWLLSFSHTLYTIQHQALSLKYIRNLTTSHPFHCSHPGPDYHHLSPGQLPCSVLVPFRLVSNQLPGWSFRSCWSSAQKLQDFQSYSELLTLPRRLSSDSHIAHFFIFFRSSLKNNHLNEVVYLPFPQPQQRFNTSLPTYPISVPSYFSPQLFS